MKPSNIQYNPSQSKALCDVPYRKQQRIKNTAYEITQVEDFLKNQMGDHWREWAINFEKNYHRKVDATDLTGGILVRFREYQKLKTQPALDEAVKWNSLDDFLGSSSNTPHIPPGSPVMRTLRTTSPLSSHSLTLDRLDASGLSANNRSSSSIGSNGRGGQGGSPRLGGPGGGAEALSMSRQLARNRSNEFDIDTITNKFLHAQHKSGGGGGLNPAAPLSPKKPQGSIGRASGLRGNSQLGPSPLLIANGRPSADQVRPQRTANDRLAFKPSPTQVARASLDNTGWPIPAVANKWLETKHPPPPPT